MLKQWRIWLFMFGCMPVYAQYPGFVPTKKVDSFMVSYQRAAGQLQRLRCSFTQEKKLVMLAQKVKSSGLFMFSKPGRVRMEYLKPSPYLMIINQDKVYVRDGTRENTINTRSNKTFQQINQVMMSSMSGQLMEQKDFQIRLFESSEQYLLEMVPKRAETKQLFDKIVILLQRRDFMVSRMELREPGGDDTIIQFNNREINVPISDSMYRLR
jgi:outer membrane lipoprotein-sorting protein